MNITSNLYIDEKIFIIRGMQVMLDRDLAELYAVETKRLNEQVKRNAERFPNDFMFQLTEKEKNELVANCDRFENMKHSSSNPYVFIEQGVSENRKQTLSFCRCLEIGDKDICILILYSKLLLTQFIKDS